VTDRRAAADPFRALGLERRRELADDDVRAAWRRVAAATHPDRADGGDPAVFAAAAAAYTVLRTRSGRGEALADLLSDGDRWRPRPAGRSRPGLRLRPGAVLGGALLLGFRIRQGRPLILAARVLIATAVAAAAIAAVGWQPASLAILAGTLTWLIRTVPSDLAPAPN
jgi:hypothetical protein